MKQLTILVTPIDAVGHVNACSGVARHLLHRGHRIVFFIEEAFRGKLVSQGFEEFVYQMKLESNNEANTNPGEFMAKKLLENRIMGPAPLLEKWNNMVYWFFESPDAYETLKQTNNHLKAAIAEIKPDLFIVDHGYLLPEIYYSENPWIRVISTVPLFYAYDETLPPAGAGLPADDPSQWGPFRAAHKHIIYSKTINDSIEKLGYERYPDDRIAPETQLMTIIGYPDELIYPQMRTKQWFNLEVFNKNDFESMDSVELKDFVSEKFLNFDLNGKFSGKLIYMSLGSMGSIDLDLMKRVIGILAKTNHKYIISKGPRHQEFGLEANMWGDRYLKQTKIIPFVDMVITHGGNNTVTETFAQGKPMLVMPMFGDQFDNAQRVHETGFGIRIDPYNFDDNELINGINQLVYNDKLIETFKKISQRIKSSNGGEKMCDKLEAVMKDFEKNNSFKC